MQGYNYNQYNGYNNGYNNQYNNYYNNQNFYRTQMYKYQQPESQTQKNIKEARNPTLVESFASFWKNCLSFKGLAARNEYWIPAIVYISIASIIRAFVVFSSVATIPNIAFAFLILIITKGVFLIPLLSLMTRRLHDFGASGDWIGFLWLIHFIPIIGVIMLWLGIILVGILPSDPKTPYRDLSKKETFIM